MTITSAQAAKLLRQYNEEYQALIDEEEQRHSFVAALGEEVESVRPAYDFAATQAALAEVADKIRHLKHAINRFNVSTTVPGFDMTVDQMLVYIPQLSKAKNRLFDLKSALPKARESAGGFGHAVIDYRYANYNVEEAAAEYRRVSDLLAQAQTALDLVNSTAPLELAD